MTLLDAIRAWWTRDAVTIRALRGRLAELERERNVARLEAARYLRVLDEHVEMARQVERARAEARQRGRFAVIDGDRRAAFVHAGVGRVM